MDQNENNSVPEVENDRYKRKRKKSFLKNARKYGKKGCFGRGVQLDGDTYQYFIKVLEDFKNGFTSDEEKEIFVRAFFTQTKDQEVDCSSNQVGCRVIEELLPYAPNEAIEQFTKVLGDNLRPLCSNRFASHVLEALLLVCRKNLDKEEHFKNFIIKVCKFLLNNLEDYMWCTYGNHVIRTGIECLAGIPNDKKNRYPVKTEEVLKTPIPAEFEEIIHDCGERLLHWPQFEQLAKEEMTSAFLQVLLRSLKKIDKKMLKNYLKKLYKIEEILPSDTLPSVFLSQSETMLLEVSIQVAGPKMFALIYGAYFKGRLPKLATLKPTNFSVQKLINNCKEKEDFEAIFEELKDSLEDISKAGNGGVILAIAENCKKFATKQGHFLQSLMTSFGCADKETDFILCLSRFCDHSKLETFSLENLQKEKLNLHGTLIMQALLDFNKPIRIVNGILNSDAKTLKSLFSNTMGSHIIDSYMKSVYVGEKSREKLVRKMQGTYQELASTKYGSRSFEALWNAANLKFKLAIMDELIYKDASWSNSEFGKIIASKVNLLMYKRSKEIWKNSLNSTNKAEKLFADILQ